MDKPTQRLNAGDLDQEQHASTNGPPRHCTDCGGEMVWAEANTSIQTANNPLYLTTRVFMRKGRFGTDMYRTNMTSCHAHVCLSCGLVKFYAVNPQELVKEW